MSLFRSLSTRLTVLYAGLFGVAMLLVAGSVWLAIQATARHEVSRELAAGGAVFDRIWAMRAGQLADGATVLSRDFGFRAAISTNDAATVSSALDNLRGRLKLDVAFVVGQDGTVTGLQGLDEAAAGKLWSALDGGASEGILQIGKHPYQAISAPIMAPDLKGWVVFAMRMDRRELAQLERLSAIPLNASLLSRGSGGAWSGADLPKADLARLSSFASESLKAKPDKPRLVGPALALVKPLGSFDGEAANVLVLRYPMARAMAPYRPMLAAVFVVGFAGLLGLIFGSFLLARTLTRPVVALDQAARRLQHGETVDVVVETDDEIGRLATSFNAMAAGIKDRERRITRMALTDQETDLPNRRAFEDALAYGGDRFVAVIGADRYAQVRAALGYHLAALMTRKIGERLAARQKAAVFARLSSERLGLLLDATDAQAAVIEAAAVLRALEQPFDLEGAAVDAAFSIGLAGLDARETVPAIERASVALEQARAQHRKIALFDADAYGDPASKLSLMSEMLTALGDGSISLHYQPKHDFRAGRVDSAEALIRWNHPKRGMVPPDLFVTLAEETGHIRALTWWTLERIITDQAALRAQGHDVVLAMNLSGRMVTETGFADEAIARVKAAGAKLVFEITETAVIGSPDLAIEVITALREAGIGISIDDYGSGLSSLTYLRQIPADELKIDKSFVQQLDGNSRDALLVRSTVDLAHSLGMKLVAEGVETAEILAILAGMGCDAAQGYHVARPMPLTALTTFLASQHVEPARPARTRAAG